MPQQSPPSINEKETESCCVHRFTDHCDTVRVSLCLYSYRLVFFIFLFRREGYETRVLKKFIHGHGHGQQQSPITITGQHIFRRVFSTNYELGVRRKYLKYKATDLIMMDVVDNVTQFFD